MKNPNLAAVCRFLKMAEDEAEAAGTATIPDEAVTNFLKANPKPTDDQMHEWAEQQGYDVHALEAKIYEIAGRYVSTFEQQGRANDKGLTPAEAPKDQLAMGKKVEAEHTTDDATKERIATDHLAEFDNYYTELNKMEGKLKKEGCLALAYVETFRSFDEQQFAKLAEQYVCNVDESLDIVQALLADMTHKSAAERLTPVDATKPVLRPDKDIPKSEPKPGDDIEAREPTKSQDADLKPAATGEGSKGEAATTTKLVDPEVKLDATDARKTSHDMASGLKSETEGMTQERGQQVADDNSLIQVNRDTRAKVAAAVVRELALGHVKRAASMTRVLRAVSHIKQAAAIPAIPPTGMLPPPLNAKHKLMPGKPSGPKTGPGVPEQASPPPPPTAIPKPKPIVKQQSARQSDAGFLLSILKQANITFPKPAKQEKLPPNASDKPNDLNPAETGKNTATPTTVPPTIPKPAEKTAVAKSDKQYRFMQLVRSIQAGKAKGSGKARAAAKSMSRKAVDDYTGKKPKGLPEKVKDEKSEKKDAAAEPKKRKTGRNVALSAGIGIPSILLLAYAARKALADRKLLADNNAAIAGLQQQRGPIGGQSPDLHAPIKHPVETFVR